MKTIFITISRGSLIRNFFHTDVVSQLLEKGLQLVVLTPFYKTPEIFPEHNHPHLILEPLIETSNLKWNKFFIELEKGAVFNRTVYTRFRYRVSGARPSRVFFIPRLLLLAPLGFIPFFKKFLRWIDFKINSENQHDYLLKKYKPDLVFSTAAGGDVSIIKGARRFGIKSVVMPKSWDNLSKLLFNEKADYMIVWSEFMKRQAMKFQDYRNNQIIVTGGPQFDYYTHTEKLLTREVFCKRFNFDPRKKIILYGSSGGNECCDELAYLELLYEFIKDGTLPDTQVLVRPHLGYLGDADRFLKTELYPGFTVDRTDKPDHKFRDHWDPSESHLNNLFNSLHHADVCVNVASTLTLDAIACGTPTINLAFDVFEGLDPHRSVKRLYQFDYIKALVGVGGVWVTRDKAEFFNALKDTLFAGRKKQEGTDRMIEHFLYRVDGQSATRIARTLISLARAHNI